MLNKKFTYAVMVLALLGFSGCSERVIVLQSGEMETPQPVITQPIVTAPVIKEEILVNQNPNLGNAVVAPSDDASIVEESTNTTGQSYSQGSTSKEPAEVQNKGMIERISFPTYEYNSLKKTGSSTVSGSVYVENRQSGEKIMGKKVKLYLNPVTSYSEQWYQESYLGGYKMSKSDNRLYNYLKYTVSNTSGKFNFFGVANGNYYLVGTVTCGQECGYSSNRTIRLVRQVYVGSGVTNANLTKNVP